MYDNIWHIRQAPVTVNPTVPNDCPIPDARTRILERRQTEDGFGRNFYYVEITYLGDQESANVWVQSSDASEKGGTEVERVDAEKVLEYVSPRELERYENEQFKIEAEAQAVADREEEQEQVRKRMAKNARMADSGRGRGSTMLDSLGIDPELGVNLGQSWSDTTRVLGFSFFDGEYIITDFVRGAISLTLCVSGFALAAVVLIVGCDLTTKCRLRHGG